MFYNFLANIRLFFISSLLLLFVLSFTNQAISQDQKVLDSLEIKEDTVIEADFIRINKDAEITIAPGKTLRLIATEQIDILDNVTVNSYPTPANNGNNGNAGKSESVVCHNGGDGLNGLNGANGMNAGNLTIVAKYLVVSNQLDINLHGGAGGRGGNGGDGGYAGRASAACYGGCDAGRGGNGGNGGDGGYGGNGGTVRLYLLDSKQNKKQITLIPPPSIQGGPGGNAGLGGIGGRGGDHHKTVCGRRNPGPNGSNGNPGRKGAKGKDGAFPIVYKFSYRDLISSFEAEQ